MDLPYELIGRFAVALTLSVMIIATAILFVIVLYAVWKRYYE